MILHYGRRQIRSGGIAHHVLERGISQVLSQDWAKEFPIVLCGGHRLFCSGEMVHYVLVRLHLRFWSDLTSQMGRNSVLAVLCGDHRLVWTGEMVYRFLIVLVRSVPRLPQNVIIVDVEMLKLELVRHSGGSEMVQIDRDSLARMNLCSAEEGVLWRLELRSLLIVIRGSETTRSGIWWLSVVSLR